jgi:hypothetical protein
MNEHPIPYTTPMVKSIMAGIKTKTRRIIRSTYLLEFPEALQFDAIEVNPQLSRIESSNDFKKVAGTFAMFEDKYGEESRAFKFPYGNVGDLLWVKETFYAYGHWTTFTEEGKSTKKFMDLTNDYNYLHQFHADWQPKKQAKFGELGWHKRPALFMPKAIAKRWIKIIDINVERLQDISDDDARDEGIKREGNLYYFYPCKDLRDDTYIENGEKVSFYSLWKSINGEESWDANPWVWGISFKVISTIGKPQ